MSRTIILLLVTLAATRTGLADPPTGAAAPSLVRVALYDHVESDRRQRTLEAILTEERGFACRRVGPADVREGVLDEVDVLVMPGGSGSAQARNLEDSGRESIRRFVRGGGAYVGICAGSYLASSDYDWSLHILNARVLDRKHWARGTGPVALIVTPTGKETLAIETPVVDDVHYGQGPLLAPGRSRDLPPYETIAIYADEIAKNGAPTGVMIGTTAIARSTFGRGRVICFSPHCEAKGGPHHLFVAGVRWASDRPRPEAEEATTRP
jgi:hypothetical protein